MAFYRNFDHATIFFPSDLGLLHLLYICATIHVYLLKALKRMSFTPVSSESSLKSLNRVVNRLLQ